MEKVNYQNLVLEGGSGGTTQSKSRHRAGSAPVMADITQWFRLLSEENTSSQSRNNLKANMVKAVEVELTPIQMDYLLLYYVSGMSQMEIATLRGVHSSTVSRTIKRGILRLKRCLKYGAGDILASVMAVEGYDS